MGGQFGDIPETDQDIQASGGYLHDRGNGLYGPYLLGVEEENTL